MSLKPPKWTGDREAFAAALVAWMREAGATNYDESVTQFEHALQSAALARERGGSETLVAAAFLHDVGHLLADEHDAHADFLAKDLEHEQIGARWLARAFGPEVTGPIGLHVAAKRYLCAVDASYHDGLSESSKRSLIVQGGPMDANERSAFLAEAAAGDALEVRRIDDLAKVAGREAIPADPIVSVLARLARSESDATMGL